MSLLHPSARLRARARRILRRLPRKSNVHRYPILKYFGTWLKRFPFLWSYKGPFTTRAIYLGSVITFLPIMGGQIFFGAALAVVLRANLPITTGLQFISNPLTGPAMYLASYQVGKAITNLIGLNAGGWATAAATYLAIGGVALGLALGLGIDVGIRIHHHRHKRRIAAYAQGSAA